MNHKQGILMALPLTMAFTVLSSTAIAAKVTLTVAHQMGTDVVTKLKKAVEPFEKKHGCEVKFNYISWQEINEKLAVMLSAGVTPDVIRMGVNPVLGSIGCYQELTPYIKRDKLDLRKYRPQAMEAAKLVRGHHYALPESTIDQVLFYNKDYFDRAGVPHPTHDWAAASWSWDEFITAAKRLTIDRNSDGKPDQYGVAGLGNWNQWGWWWGTNWVTPDIKRGNLTDPKLVQAIQSIYDVNLVHRVQGGDFASGKAAMDIQSNPHMRNMVKAKFVWDIGALPKPVTRATLMNIDGLGIGSRSKRKELAWQFIKYFSYDAVGSAAWTDGVDSMPALLSLSKRYAELQSKVRPGVDYDVYEKANICERPEALNDHKMQKRAERLLEEALTKARLGRMSAAQALSSIATQFDALIQKGIIAQEGK